LIYSGEGSARLQTGEEDQGTATMQTMQRSERALERMVPSRPRPRELGALVELVENTADRPVDTDEVHELMATLLLQAYRARSE
jgi:hypothetical protein